MIVEAYMRTIDVTANSYQQHIEITFLVPFQNNVEGRVHRIMSMFKSNKRVLLDISEVDEGKTGPLTIDAPIKRIL